MIDGAFLKGTLEMPVNPAEGEGAQLVWNMLLTNRILCAIAIILVLITLVDILRLMPRMISCISRWRPCLTIEHSLSLAKPRNQIGAVFALCFCLLADRFGLYRPAFMDLVPPLWSALAVIGIFSIYLFLRRIIYKMFNFGYIPTDEKQAVHNTLITFISLGTITMLLTVGAMYFFKVPDEVVRIVLWSILGVNWLVSFIRTGQIIANSHSGLTTFLYLCALEILPAGLVAASALLL